MATANPTVRYRTITPEEASVYLRRSKRKNVPTKKSKIDQYARDMLGGKWDPYNSQAVSIDWNEDIVNGHQRLMACVQAGVPFRTMLITGVPPDTFATEDTGRTRDAGHYFALLGEKNYFALAAAARSLYLWERGMWQWAASPMTRIFIPNEALKEELDRRPRLREAADLLSNNGKVLKGRFPFGVLGALYVLTADHPRHKTFWAELVERVGGEKGSPAWQLNRRIDMAKASQARLSGPALLALLTKAWNFYSAGLTKELIWSPKKEKTLPQPTTDLVPALLPPADGPAAEIITTSPVPKRRPAAGPPVLKVVPAPKPRAKKVKLRGGLGSGTA